MKFTSLLLGMVLFLAASGLQAGWVEQALPTKGFMPEQRGLGGIDSMALDGNVMAVADGWIYSGDTLNQSPEVLVYRRIQGTWTREAVIPAPAGVADFGPYGVSIALSGDTLALGYSRESLYQPSFRSVVVYVRGSSGWQLQATISSDLPAEEQQSRAFGSCLAMDGDTLLISDASGYSEQPFNRVHVMVRQRGKWFRQQALIAPESDDYGLCQFGTSLAIHGDTAIVGAPSDSPGPEDKVHVYQRRNARWSLKQSLASGSQGRSRFGTAVAFHDRWLVVGAPGRATGGDAQVFELSGGAWRFRQLLVPALATANDQFGAAVAIHGDRVLIGGLTHTFYAYYPIPPTKGGAVLFTRSNKGWSEGPALAQDDSRDVADGFVAVAAGADAMVVFTPGTDKVWALTETQPHLSLMRGTGAAASRLIGSTIAPIELGPVDAPPQLTFTLKNEGTRPVEGLSVIVSPPAAFYVAAPVVLPRTRLRGGESMVFTVAFSVSEEPSPVDVEDALTAIVRVRAAGSVEDVWRQPVVFSINTDGGEPHNSPWYEPLWLAPQILKVGDHLRLSLPLAGDQPMRYEWRKDEKVIPGATSADLLVRSVTLEDAGTYDVRATNASGTMDYPLWTSVAVVGGIVGPTFVKPGGSAEIKAIVAGPNLTFSWSGGFSAGVDDGRVTGSDTSVLKLTRFDSDLCGDYNVVIECAGAVRYENWDRTLQLAVPLTAVPDPFRYQRWAVGYPASGLSLVGQHPMPGQRFSATGLPPGMTIDPLTGLISGVPQRAELYQVVITTTSLFGSSRLDPLEVAVNDWTPAAYGTYRGVVPRDAVLNDGLGGSFTATLASNGMITGQMSCGTQVCRFVGHGESYSNATYVAIVRSADNSHDMALRMTVDAMNWTGQMTVTLHNAEGDPDLTFTAAYAIADGANAVPQVYEGRYTFLLQSPASQTGDPAWPQGVGFATMSVDAVGNAEMSGVLPDSSPITFAGALDTNGLLRLHFPLYAGGGSAQGTLQFNRPDDADPGKDRLSGVIDWLKRPSRTRNDPHYAAGLPLHDLSVEGDRYSAPGLGARVLNLADKPDNARLSFLSADASDQTSLNSRANCAFRVLKDDRSAFSPNHPGKPTMVIQSATGFFRGRMTLSNGSAKARPLSFSGVIVDSLAQGRGLMLLESVATKRMLSGAVMLVPQP